MSLPEVVWWELRRRNPAMDLRLLRHCSLAAGSVRGRAGEFKQHRHGR